MKRVLELVLQGAIAVAFVVCIEELSRRGRALRIFARIFAEGRHLQVRGLREDHVGLVALLLVLRQAWQQSDPAIRAPLADVRVLVPDNNRSTSEILERRLLQDQE